MPRKKRKPSRFRIWITNAGLVILSVFAVLILCELALRFFHGEGVASHWESYQNIFVRQLENNRPCSYADSLIAHPFLSFVYQSSDDCRVQPVNNKGLSDSRDIPDRRDPRFFTILMTGGSVADQMTRGKSGHGPGWLEKDLNQNYQSPNGKPFRVLNGAVGGWRLPDQNNMVTLYGDVVDAVIALDGYNEALNTSVSLPIDRPDYLYFQLINARYGWFKNMEVGLLQKWRRFASETPLIDRSYLAFFIFENAMKALATPDMSSAHYKAVDRHFSLPNGWSHQEIDAWNRKKFESYEKLLFAEARALQIPYVHFLQPIRLIDKNLTPEELKTKDPVTKENYESIFVEGSKDLGRQGYAMLSLLDVFKDTKDTIYGDFIHCKWVKGDNPGYLLMAQRMSADLARLWHLKPRPPVQGAH